MENSLLETIKSPDDVKALDSSDLDRLCKEIRLKLIDTVSKNGGHLASNLGTVELTVALHRSFNSPDDKIVFDVGHQCYTHKLLTGRYDRFDTLRLKDGISGFPRTSESPHDIFSTGHSSTSISAAYGLSVAENIRGGENFSIAVIGDGAFTGGLSFEAINNVSSEGSRMIVILNDNDMSISKNVGAITAYLSKIRSSKRYFRLKAGTERFLNHIPFIGRSLSESFYKLKTAVKNTIYNSNMFEDLGFRYMGPVDGHDVSKLCDVFEQAKKSDKPIFLHVHTVKGKGYELAEKNPSEFHGISKFDVLTGEAAPCCRNFSDEFGRCLCALAEKDDRICAITAAMSLGTGLSEFSEKIPDRFFDVGIAEEHAAVFASGLARGGMVPFFVVYSTFLQRCYDQLIHDVALQKRKIIIAIDRAGLTGSDGETHQGIFDVAFLNTVSNFTIYSPATYEELCYDINKAVYDAPYAVAIRYPKGSMPDFPEDFVPKHGIFDIYGNDTADVSIVTYGRISAYAFKAVKHFEKEGRSVNAVKLNQIKPLSPSIVDYLKHRKHIYFFEEGLQNGGVAEKLALRLLEAGYKGSYKLTAIDYCFVEQGTVEEQLREYGLDYEGMINTLGGAFDE